MAGKGKGNRTAGAVFSPMPPRVKEMARLVARVHAIDFGTACFIVLKIWNEATRCLFEVMGRNGAGAWQRLPFKEKAAICSVVVKNLLDGRKVTAFIEDRRKGIV